MQKVNVKPRQSFFKDVDDAVRFLANTSKTASIKLEKVFKMSLLELQTNALSYPLFHKNFRKLNVAKYYVVFYEIIGKDVFVDKVYDTRTEEYSNIVLSNQ